MKAENFAGKVALITGGSRGVGLALARQLAERGAKVVITARGEARLLDSQKRLAESGAEVRAVAGDVGKWDDARKMVDAALDNFARLDILVNNAGVSMRGDFAELNPEVCDRVLATNLAGCITLTRLGMDRIIKNRGSVVFISSIAGLFGLPGASIYCATKKALTGLAESLRIELAGTGVHVGVVYLGFTEHDPEKRILAHDGSLTPPDRPAHHTQDHAAGLIVKMLQHRKRQLVMTPAGKIGATAYRLSPWLLEKAIIWTRQSQLGIFKRFS
jgi:NAD(P)-dependent dehydrogenase (short-subunit alcohol dehydrogenase family)